MTRKKPVSNKLDERHVWWVRLGRSLELLSTEGGRYGALSNIEETFEFDVDCDLSKWFPESIMPLPPALLTKYASFFKSGNRELCAVWKEGELIAYLIRSAR